MDISLPDTAILEILKKSMSWSDISTVCTLSKHVREICREHQDLIKAHVLFNKFGRRVFLHEQYWEIGTNAETTQKLVELGVDVSDNTIIRAAELGLLDVIRVLHRRGGDIRAQEDLVLRRAARHGHLNVVKYLLDNGADPRVDDLVLNVIFQAVLSGNIELIRYLHENLDISIHIDNDSCLLIAADNGDINMVEYLLQNGANVNTGSSQALIDAVEMDSTELVHLLVNYQVDVSAQDNKAIVTAAEFPDPEILQILLENGANPNARGGLPLYISVSNLLTENVILLLQFDAEVTGDAFVESAVGGSLEIMRLLITADDSVIQEHGRDAMLEAIDRGFHRIIRELMRSGVEFNEEYLYIAVTNNDDSTHVVRTLLENTNKEAIPDEVIKNAIRFAENENNENIVEFLTDAFTQNMN